MLPTPPELNRHKSKRPKIQLLIAEAFKQRARIRQKEFIARIALNIGVPSRTVEDIVQEYKTAGYLLEVDGWLEENNENN